MNKETADINDIQRKLLEILLYFDEFCKMNGLKYVLAGGTCLGAVRHSGFIPWDDDVDVFMLREDYEKLKILWDRNADCSRYECIRSNDKINIHHSATEIKDCNTTFINRHSMNLDINQGLMIDVIPLDYVAERKMRKLSQYIFSMAYCCFNFQRLPEHKSSAIYYLTKVALGIIPGFYARYAIWKTSEYAFIKLAKDDKKFVASFGEGATIMKQHFPVEWFTNPVEISFENVLLPVPNNCDEYLKISYGDYMKLPPIEDQIPRHDTVFVDLNNSYLNYKGIKYLIEK